MGFLEEADRNVREYRCTFPWCPLLNIRINAGTPRLLVPGECEYEGLRWEEDIDPRPWVAYLVITKEPN